MEHLTDEFHAGGLIGVLFLEIHHQTKGSILKGCIGGANDNRIPIEVWVFEKKRTLPCIQDIPIPCHHIIGDGRGRNTSGGIGLHALESQKRENVSVGRRGATSLGNGEILETPSQGKKNMDGTIRFRLQLMHLLTETTARVRNWEGWPMSSLPSWHWLEQWHTLKSRMRRRRADVDIMINPSGSEAGINPKGLSASLWRMEDATVRDEHPRRRSNEERRGRLNWGGARHLLSHDMKLHSCLSVKAPVLKYVMSCDLRDAEVWRKAADPPSRS